MSGELKVPDSVATALIHHVHLVPLAGTTALSASQLFARSITEKSAAMPSQWDEARRNETDDELSLSLQGPFSAAHNAVSYISVNLLA